MTPAGRAPAGRVSAGRVSAGGAPPGGRLGGLDLPAAVRELALRLGGEHDAGLSTGPGAAGESAAAGFEAALWDRAREVLTGVAGDHGWPPALLALLAGVPLPAKANLRLRWARGADREAAYVSVPNPLGGQLTGRRPAW